MPPAPLADRIERYVAGAGQDSFEELAMAAFAQLYQGDPGFRALCDEAGACPGEIDGWQAIPPARAPASSRSEGEPASGAGLRRSAAVHAFRAACLSALGAPPLLGLVGKTEAPGAAPIESCGGYGSLAAGSGGRIEVGAARSWLAARQRDRRPAVIAGTPTAFERLIGTLERQDLRFQLAWGSRVMLLQEGRELFGMDALGLARRAADRLALAPELLLRELRWPGVPTPLYGRLSPDGGVEEAHPAPWLRVRALDPETLEALPDREVGVLSVLDLTVRGRPFRLVVPSQGSVEAGAVRVAAAPS